MMRRVLALVLLLCALPAAATEWIGELSAADKRAVEAAAVQADANWNARNAAALADMYADDATLVVGGGELMQGQSAVLDYFARSFARAPASLHHTTMVERLVVLAPNLVLADTRVALDQSEAHGTRKRVRDFDTMTLLAKRDGAWKLRTVRAYPAASR